MTDHRGSEVVAAPDRPVTTDVKPRDGHWLATCDCGQSTTVLTCAGGSDWVLDHRCADAQR